MKETITGKILTIRYYAEDKCFGIVMISYNTPNGVIKLAVKGKMANPVKDAEIECEGEFVRDPKWGLQFIATASKINVTGRDATISFLGSGFIKGLGPVLAERVYDMFGESSFKVIEQTPALLSSVKGISEEKAKKIAESYTEAKAYKELVALLPDVSSGQIVRIYDALGKNSVEIIKQDPYQLIYKVDGIGFYRADKIAKSSGIAQSDPRRVKAAIYYTINNMQSNGHCYCNLWELASAVRTEIKDIVVNDDEILRQTASLIQANLLVKEKGSDAIYVKPIYEAESGCARELVKLLHSNFEPFPTKAIDNAIRMIEGESCIEYEPSQKSAIVTSLKNPVSVITGGPGTGKSTITRGIVKACDLVHRNIILLAPTGRAAKRMSEITGYPAQTVFRYVYVENKLVEIPKNSVVIVDESSMLDLSLAYRLLKKNSENCMFIFIGDNDQLQPIGAGHFFKDIIASPRIPTTWLSIGFRTKGSIALNANHINRGETLNTFTFNEQFRMIPIKSDVELDNIQEIVAREYLRMLQKYSIKEVQILTPRRAKILSSADELNLYIREIVNPYDDSNPYIKGVDFRIGDRVMYIRNNYKLEVCNGELGIVTNIDPEDKVITVDFDDIGTVNLQRTDFEDLVLAYASTVHKAQGSEFKGVIYVQTKQSFTLLQRNLIYTAVTRAKEEIAIIAQPESIGMAINKTDSRLRNTMLKARIANL